MSDGIKVQGLKQFRRELKALEDNELYVKQLKEVHNRIAKIVLEEARAQASTALERKAAGGLTAGKTVGGAVIHMGGAKYPFAGGAEFGAIKYPQFKPWRGNQYTVTWTDDQIGNAGYFVFPAIAKKRDQVIEIYMDEIERIARGAFPD